MEAATLLTLIQDRLERMATMEDLYCNSTLSDLLRLVDSSDPSSQSNAPDNTQLWLEDISRVEDIGLDPNWELEDEGRVFIPGLTGFVGAHFLHHILQRYDLWDGCKEHSQKLVVLDGDLSDSTLGLGAEKFTWLSNWASIIFHLGAKVNFCDSYREHHASNVLGTCNALRLAAAGRRKAFHYFSSIDVWGPTGLILGTKEVYEDEPLMPHSQAVDTT
ncbi:hypothetical protein BBP40_009352 [Aspergillus hancockii]|nr:hypothetical protein BBP40_009352 [Aspergillus hancockii]